MSGIFRRPASPSSGVGAPPMTVGEFRQTVALAYTVNAPFRFDLLFTIQSQAPSAQPSKFKVHPVGTFRVPPGYDAQGELQRFCTEHASRFGGNRCRNVLSLCETVQDVLQPDELIEVEVLEQTQPMTHRERIALLKERQALFVGPSGLVFLCQQHRAAFTRWGTYMSYSNDNPAMVAEGIAVRGIAYLSAHSGGSHVLGVVALRETYPAGSFLVCFKKVLEDLNLP